MGTVTHYFPEPEVAVVKMERDAVSVGETVHVTGHTTDLTFEVGSMEVDHEAVETAEAGAEVGMKVPGRCREHDEVFKVVAGGGEEE